MGQQEKAALMGLAGGIASGFLRGWEQDRENLMKREEWQFKAGQDALKRTSDEKMKTAEFSSLEKRGTAEIGSKEKISTAELSSKEKMKTAELASLEKRTTDEIAGKSAVAETKGASSLAVVEQKYPEGKTKTEPAANKPKVITPNATAKLLSDEISFTRKAIASEPTNTKYVKRLYDLTIELNKLLGMKDDSPGEAGNPNASPGNAQNAINKVLGKFPGNKN